MEPVVNKHSCAEKIWKKFTTPEKERYNQLRELLSWDFIYHVDINKHWNKMEIIDVTAHNIACELVWSEKK
jgi:hypothetical protein